MDKLDNGKKYTFAQIADMRLEDFTLETKFIGRNNYPVQLHHANLAELLLIPSWANSIWEFKYSSTGSVPVFRFCDTQGISSQDILAFEVDFDEADDHYPLVVAPKMFPYPRRHLTLDQAVASGLEPSLVLIQFDLYLNLYKYMYRLAEHFNISKFEHLDSGNINCGFMLYLSAPMQNDTSINIMLPATANYYEMDQFDCDDREHLVICRSFDFKSPGSLTIGAAEKFNAQQSENAIEYIKQLMEMPEVKILKSWELKPKDYFSLYGKDYTVEEVDSSAGVSHIKVVDHKRDDESYILVLGLGDECVLLDRTFIRELSVKECMFNIKQSRVAWNQHCAAYNIEPDSVPELNQLFSLLDR